ncbi:RNA polymerase sigma-70 factor, ECF subfamily [Arthrobacter sp. cf158]|uniref:RNA polymerase sigma factor n=1 Tax=Arthrobacter sp. cf158 TaxID=1761744 RepID=UPI0008989BFD|nr:RNA polymerase sigma factor [Arthrobacter sp. cf158]SDX25589.1 RNA polymerase sigma-70 factor, ECF subfamily [Arthrobacter sp. cf158]
MENVQLGDDVLWAESLKGDAEAFGLLYDRHRGRVFRHAYRLTGGKHDAEDATAAAFFELWRRRERVRVVEGSILPWLLVTATNSARNLQRSKVRHRRLLAAIPRRSEAEAELDPAHSNHDFSMTDEVAQALAVLKPLDLTLVSFVVFEELPLPAAAEAVGISPGAAKVRMHRARQKLKAALPRSFHHVHSPALKGDPS